MVTRTVTVSAVCLNQWSLDFAGNKNRIIESIMKSTEKGAVLRTGPDLETTGYHCQDHFFESDTIAHSWEVIADILPQIPSGMLVEIGAPVLYNSRLYICRIFVSRNNIHLIVPKSIATNQDARWFAPWTIGSGLQHFTLPVSIMEITGSRTVPIGQAALEALCGTTVATCPSTAATSATRVNETTYLHATMKGCDGDRFFFNGGAHIVSNGIVVASTPQFDIRSDVDIAFATIEMSKIRESIDPTRAIIRIPFVLATEQGFLQSPAAQELMTTSAMELMAKGPAAWLWDYLRRSGAGGFFIALSGGADSAAVLTICSSMCRLVWAAAQLDTGGSVARDLRRVLLLGEHEALPSSAHMLTSKLIHTAYMSTKISSEKTRSRSARIAAEIGSNHHHFHIDDVSEAFLCVVSGGKFPVTSGDIAIQNLQARIRLVAAYLAAQIGVDGKKLLVLSTGNADEALRGYMTKYDCSSGDLSPIGGFTKAEIRRFLTWAADSMQLPSLREIACATPSAELKLDQTDESDMGMTYEELELFGRLRTVERCGPVSMFRRLVSHEWRHLDPNAVADKVKLFFIHYCKNRHKITTLTPAFQDASVDNADCRPFLYPGLEFQFDQIDRLVHQMNS